VASGESFMMAFAFYIAG